MKPVEVLALMVSLILGLSLEGPQGPYPLPKVETVEVITAKRVIGRTPQGPVTIKVPMRDFSGWFDAEANRIQLKATCLPRDCDPILVHELAHWLASYYGVNNEEIARYVEECYRLRYHLPKGWPLMRRLITEEHWRPSGLPPGRCKQP